VDLPWRIFPVPGNSLWPSWTLGRPRPRGAFAQISSQRGALSRVWPPTRYCLYCNLPNAALTNHRNLKYRLPSHPLEMAARITITGSVTLSILFVLAATAQATNVVWTTSGTTRFLRYSLPLSITTRRDSTYQMAALFSTLAGRSLPTSAGRTLISKPDLCPGTNLPR
jgi:hypothetical protein